MNAEYDANMSMPAAMSPTAAEWWDMAEPALSALREPEAWFRRIAERVEVRDDELHRHVSMTLRAPRQVDLANGFVVVAVQTPRKGTLVDFELLSDGNSKAHVLTHEQHTTLSKMMLTFRFRSVMRLALRVAPRRKELAVSGPEVLQRLLDLVDGDIESRSEPAAIRSLFRDGRLKGFPKGRKKSPLRREMAQLYWLCQILTDRYYRFIQVPVQAGTAPELHYRYAQEREARSYGFRIARWLRRLFRAPASLFFVHAPLARQTPQYELRLEPIDGYYIREQFVLKSGDDPSSAAVDPESNVPMSPHQSETWWSSRRGGWTSGFVYVGNGHQSDGRLYAAFRLLEVPPGATGRAWAGTALGALILFSVVIWSLLHGPDQSTIAPEILLALVAAGSAALDNTTVKREVFNAPFLPRLVLFNQTILAIVAAVWLLTRGTAESMVPIDASLQGPAAMLTFLEPVIGIAILLVVALQFGFMTWRTIVAAQVYDRAMSESLATEGR